MATLSPIRWLFLSQSRPVLDLQGWLAPCNRSAGALRSGMRSPTAVVVIALCLVQGMVEVAAGGEKNLPNRNADKAASAVKLEFAAPLRRTERQILAEAGVEVAEYLGSNQ